MALAAYQLVCDAADAGPVVLIVDDAQWLDRSSMGALAFIARRLESEPVALLACVMWVLVFLQYRDSFMGVLAAKSAAAHMSK